MTFQQEDEKANEFFKECEDNIGLLEASLKKKITAYVKVQEPEMVRVISRYSKAYLAAPPITPNQRIWEHTINRLANIFGDEVHPELDEVMDSVRHRAQQKEERDASVLKRYRTQKWADALPTFEPLGGVHHNSRGGQGQAQFDYDW
jgi:hypothetical protein